MMSVVDDFFGWADHVTDSTKATWRTGLDDYTAFLAEEDIEPAEADLEAIEAYLSSLVGEYHPNTIRSRYGTVRRFYGELHRKEVVDDNPCEHVMVGKYLKATEREHSEPGSMPVREEDFKALCDNVPNPAVRNEAILRFMYDSGARANEVESLTMDSLDLAADPPKAVLWGKKTGDKRTVFFSPSTKIVLEKWIDNYRDVFRSATGSDHVFVSRKNGTISAERIGDMVAETAERAEIQYTMYVDAAGIERRAYTSHSLRSGHAVRALLSGVDLRAVQKQLGHSDISQTQQYLKYIDSDVGDAYEDNLW